MLFRFHLWQHRFEFAIWSNDERGALRTKIGFAIHGFFDPDAISLGDSVIFIHKERERQVELFDELRMTARGVDAHAKDPSFGGEFCPAIAQSARLLGAAGCVILWVKVKDDGFTFQTFQIKDGTWLMASADDRGFEERSGFANGGIGGSAHARRETHWL